MTPGNRLRRARRLKFKKRTDFYDHLIGSNYQIDYARIGRLERDEDSPSIEEVDLLCSVLDMTADFYLRGVTHSTLVLHNRVDELMLNERMLVFMFIDAIRFR